MSTKDNFIYSLHETPREEFSKSLYQHLMVDDGQQLRKKRHRLWITSTITALTLIFGAVSIPGVRAAILETLEEIAGVKFLETSEYPGSNDVTTIPYNTMSLDLARNEYNLSLPDWTPEGYDLDDTVQVAETDGSFRHLILTWNKLGEPNINLEVTLQESTIIVGPESIDNIEIGEKSVAVWHGGWNYDKEEWDESINIITLSWSDDGIIAYHLIGSNGETSVANLIKMIESIP